MNREFMLIDEKKRGIITDDNGKINFKNVEEFSKESLLYENKMEIIENNLTSLKEKLKKHKNNIHFLKIMLHIIAFMFLLIFILSVIFGITIPNFFTDCNTFLTILFSDIILASTIIVIGKSILKRKVKNIDVQLILLEKIKEKVKQEKVNKNLDVSKMKENEPVSLIEETNKYEIETDTLLKNVYRDSKKQGPINCDDLFSKYPITGNWNELVKFYNVTTEEDLAKLYEAIYYLNFDYKRMDLNYKTKNRLFYYLELEKLYEKNHGISLKREK